MNISPGLPTSFVSSCCLTVLGLAGAFLPVAAFAEEIEVVVTFQNLSAEELFIDSPWIGFQDGALDIYDSDSGPSKGLSWLATTGRATLLAEEFAASGSAGASAVLPLPGGTLSSGERISRAFVLDSESEASRFLTFAASLSTLDGTFIAAENPVAYPLVDEAGGFVGTSFLITDQQVFSLTDSGEFDPAKAAAAQRFEDAEEDELPRVRPQPGAVRKRERPGEIGILELARVTVRQALEEEEEFFLSDTASELDAPALSLESAPLDFASRGGEGDAGAGGEGSAEEGEESEDPSGESKDDLDLDRWQRSLEAAEEEPGEEEDEEEEPVGGF